MSGRRFGNTPVNTQHDQIEDDGRDYEHGVRSCALLKFSDDVFVHVLEHVTSGRLTALRLSGANLARESVTCEDGGAVRGRCNRESARLAFPSFLCTSALGQILTECSIHSIGGPESLRNVGLEQDHVRSLLVFGEELATHSTAKIVLLAHLVDWGLPTYLLRRHDVLCSLLSAR